MASNNFDYNGYEKSLEKILVMTEKDYWVQYVDINRHQVNVAKTYLWVAAALIGAYAAFLGQYKEIIMSGSICPILVMILSIGLAIIAFGLCLYSIPARKGYRSIADPSWGEFSQKSHVLLTQKEPNLYVSILSALIDRVDLRTNHNVATNQKRAKLLRLTSWILIFSFCMALLSVASFAISKLEISIIPSTKLETNMSTENNTTTPSETPSSPPAEQPNVPKPAGPIGQGTDQPNYTTHGLDIPKDGVRITEGNEGGSSSDD